MICNFNIFRIAWIFKNIFIYFCIFEYIYFMSHFSGSVSVMHFFKTDALKYF